MTVPGGALGAVAFTPALFAGIALPVVGLAVLIAGMQPPGVLGTGQLHPGHWMVPGLIGFALLAIVLTRIGARLGVALLAAGAATIVPPLLLCVTGAKALSGLSGLRVADVAKADSRPVVAVLSGPRLFGLRANALNGFVAAPLWRLLDRRFALRPFDALDPAAMAKVRTLLIVQPRQLFPEELVALDAWVRGGGRAVILADPDLRWADARPLGDPLRAPSASLLGPILAHWGLALTADGRGDVDRRFLGDGYLLQTLGAGHWRTFSPHCAVGEGGLVARCRIGKGVAILVADADFANDTLWTASPGRPADAGQWTSDAPAVLADWLSDGAGGTMGQRAWLARADGLAGALVLPCIVLLATGIFGFTSLRRTNREKGMS